MTGASGSCCALTVEAVALGADRKKFEKMADDMANSQQFTEGYATVVAQANEIKSIFDEMGALSTQLNRADLSVKEQTELLLKGRGKGSPARDLFSEAVVTELLVLYW